MSGSQSKLDSRIQSKNFKGYNEPPNGTNVHPAVQGVNIGYEDTAKSQNAAVVANAPVPGT